MWLELAQLINHAKESSEFCLVFGGFNFHNGFHFFGADTLSFGVDEGVQKFYEGEVSFLELLKSGLQVFFVLFHLAAVH